MRGRSGKRPRTLQKETPQAAGLSFISCLGSTWPLAHVRPIEPFGCSPSACLRRVERHVLQCVSELAVRRMAGTPSQVRQVVIEAIVYDRSLRVGMASP